MKQLAAAAILLITLSLFGAPGLTVTAAEPAPESNSGSEAVTLDDLLIYLNQANDETQTYRESVLAALAETNRRFEYATTVLTWILAVLAFTAALVAVLLIAASWGNH